MEKLLLLTLNFCENSGPPTANWIESNRERSLNQIADGITLPARCGFTRQKLRANITYTQTGLQQVRSIDKIAKWCI